MLNITSTTSYIPTWLAQLITPKPIIMPERNIALDWLRVIAFGLLILFHTGMLYSANWGFHIKSQYQSSALESLMLLIEPWRMGLLWLISGVATRYLLSKGSTFHFLIQRTNKLLLPLLFGILVVVPPQLFYEMSFNGDINTDYINFYLAFLELEHPMFANYKAGIWPHIDVNHLWYLRELWLFTLGIVILSPLLNHRITQTIVAKLLEQRSEITFILLYMPFLLAEILDTTREARGFMFLLYGYLIAWQPALWQRLKSCNIGPITSASILCYLVLVSSYNLIWLPNKGQLSGGYELMTNLIYSLDYCLWLVMVLVLASRLFTKKTPLLSYLNQIVFPAYILHQTVIITLGFEITRFKLGPIIEPMLLLLLTLIITLSFIEAIKRVPILRSAMGMSPLANEKINDQRKPKDSAQRLPLKTVITSLVLLPLMLEILI